MAFPEYPKEIARLVVEEWKNTSNLSEYTPRPCLPESAINTLFEICFFASLRREEERVIQFNVALCPPSALEKVPFRFSKFTKAVNLIRFGKPERLSIDRLVRLAPACDPDKMLILVNYDTATNEFQMWGIADIGWRIGIESMSLTELRVRAFGPAQFGITLHGRNLCTYNHGRILRVEKALINSGCIYEFFRETSLEFCREVTAPPDGAFFDVSFNERDYRAIGYLTTLRELVERVQRLKHGGCIFVVSENKSNRAIVDVDIKYDCRDESIWQCLKGRWILHDKYYRALESAKQDNTNAEELAALQREKEDVEIGLRDSLDNLARLTAVDGAVIVTRKFELLGFGAVVRLDRTGDYKVFKAEDRSGKSKREVGIETYGTRHRAAFEFCYKNLPSVAIVLSQDGGIKFVTRIGDDLYFWETSLFDVQEVFRRSSRDS